VHFLRFEFDLSMCATLKAGGALRFGVDHQVYSHEVEVAEAVRVSLSADLD
jgi:hypothetical protein